MNAQWKDYIAREVLIITALWTAAIAGQPLLLYLRIPIGVWRFTVFLYWLRLCYGAVQHARTRPHLHAVCGLSLAVTGTFLVMLGPFTFFGWWQRGRIVGLVLLVAGIGVIAVAKRFFGKASRADAPMVSENTATTPSDG